ncbi:branched-chain amino acid ABC transporter permease [Actibacterium pelagium]|uniref:Branched-chain amino acid ABC transporter permease n=1 Tax=Actibacterium pelagium TaxID=2029103 RepID=A0A917AKJ2_9RHOB|nr:branched-chain amino acid ABC transporter permease [Actibacterium pelagium]GGE55920.1 branched-chain amino acid ABC transporter permease [Actibacterium pelagium]
MIQERYLNALVLFGLIAVPLYAMATEELFTITLATRAVILALAAVGLNLALGLGGLVSFGHATFFGIGGYTMGVLAYHAQTYTALDLGLFTIEGTKSMPIIWLVAIILSSLVAVVIGMLSLRTSGVYFIMITLAFGQMFFFFTISWAAYGGEDGLSIYVRNGFPGLNTLVPIQFYGICFVILCAVLFLNARLAKSPFGLALNAARQTPMRTQTVGLDPTRLKLVAFVISGAITGLAGALFADLNRFVSPTMFSWQFSGEIMLFIILGGVGRLFGPVIGAVIFVTLEHFLGEITDFWHIYLGVILVIIVLFARGGIVGLLSGRGGGHD